MPTVVSVLGLARWVCTVWIVIGIYFCVYESMSKWECELLMKIETRSMASIRKGTMLHQRASTHPSAFNLLLLCICSFFFPTAIESSNTGALVGPHDGAVKGIFDVTAYGAVGDGITLDTAAVRKAAAALASSKHGGELRFPGPRKTYLTGKHPHTIINETELFWDEAR